jgi:capsular polysaccharide biosynthesis protein
VIAPHGAGLVNVLWSRPGVQVLELTPSEENGPGLFHSITTCTGGTYWWLPGTARGPGGSPTIHQDFELDPQLLTEALAHCGADR